MTEIAALSVLLPLPPLGALGLLLLLLLLLLLELDFPPPLPPLPLEARAYISGMSEEIRATRLALGWSRDSTSISCATGAGSGRANGAGLARARVAKRRVVAVPTFILVYAGGVDGLR